MTILPIYAAPERLRPWIAGATWTLIALSAFGLYLLTGA